MVTGPQSSGTRLLADVLTAGEVQAWHDKSHGTIHREAELVTVIVRDAAATRASRDAAFEPGDRIDRADSLAGCARYPDAMWLTYEQICANPAATVRVLAGWLGVEPWPLPFAVVDQNAKWADGGGPQIQPVGHW